SPDSSTAALYGDPGGVSVWDAATHERILWLPDARPPYALGPGVVAAAQPDDTLALYDVASGERRLNLPGPVSGFWRAAAFSPDGSRLAYGVGNEVVIVDAQTGAEQLTFGDYPEGQTISHLIWAPDGGALVAASGQDSDYPTGTVILWELGVDGPTAQIRVENLQANWDIDWLQLALFNPSGRLVALERNPGSRASDIEVVVVDRQTGETAREANAYRMQHWVSEDVLLATEAAGSGSFVEFYIAAGERLPVNTTGSQAFIGVYFPDGPYHGEIRHVPPPPRGVRVTNWREGQQVTSVSVDVDVQGLSLSPDGCRLLVRGIYGVVYVVPVGW
ncbi:MAG: WD40 repeat domain-containing protein, partial [Anaerolineae bacterium]